MKKINLLFLVFLLTWISPRISAQTVVYDDSDSPFTILASPVSVLTPNGGESWAVGSSQNIIWSTTGTVGDVNIDYSTNSGSNWVSVATNTANDGTFTWTVPNTPSTACLIRVREIDGSPTDWSDAVFTITTSTVETMLIS